MSESTAPAETWTVALVLDDGRSVRISGDGHVSVAPTAADSNAYVLTLPGVEEVRQAAARFDGYAATEIRYQH
jgi:hypothetical protein